MKITYKTSLLCAIGLCATMISCSDDNPTPQPTPPEFVNAAKWVELEMKNADGEYVAVENADTLFLAAKQKRGTESILIPEGQYSYNNAKFGNDVANQGEFLIEDEQFTFKNVLQDTTISVACDFSIDLTDSTMLISNSELSPEVSVKYKYLAADED